MLHTNYKKREYIAKVLGFIPSVVISEKHVGKRVESKVGRLLLAMYLTKTKGNGLERAVSTAMYQDFFVEFLMRMVRISPPLRNVVCLCWWTLTLAFTRWEAPRFSGRGPGSYCAFKLTCLPFLGSSPSLFLTYDPLKGRDFSLRRNKVFLVSEMDRLVL